MSLHTASMNARSCDTNNVAVFVICCNRCSSHSTPSTERWFVGSSRINRSGSSIKAAASATRLRCPPESSPIFRDRNSLHPSLSSAACALVSVSHASSVSICSNTAAIFDSSMCPALASAMTFSYRRNSRISGVSLVYTASNTPSSGSNGGSCSRNARFRSFLNHSSPSSLPTSFPANTESNVLLPLPFGPTIATLWPSLNAKSMFRNWYRSPSCVFLKPLPIKTASLPVASNASARPSFHVSLPRPSRLPAARVTGTPPDLDARARRTP
mmetsp:Transcript_10740/g.39801  ORF Transcript_10740/g.39801 Transcript_10740/m.39801 type:complete len:270 (+) Transcript_10740:1416-2225(+)